MMRELQQLPAPGTGMQEKGRCKTVCGPQREHYHAANAGLLFDWLYPAHLPTLRACLEAWADSPDVTTPALKFMAEFAHNKTQRLTFDSSSPNGILLFREVSKVREEHHPSFFPAALGISGAVSGLNKKHGAGSWGSV